MNQNLRLLAFSISVSIFLALTIAVGLTESLEKDAQYLIPLYIGMTILGLAVWGFFPNMEFKPRSVLLVLILAVISRLLMAGFPTSDDVNRYLWEGKLLQAGESPYAFTADSPEWEHHRDSVWEAMNHRDKKTAYPPLALMVFAGLNFISYSPWIYKLFFGFMDLAALGSVICLLGMRKLPIRNSLLYALSPVTIIGFSGEAHFDSLYLFLTLAALILFEKEKVSYGWILLGLSIQIKIISVLIIPLLLWKYRSAKALWIVVSLLLPTLLFWQDMPNLIDGIARYGGTMSHNGSINHLFIDFWGSREIASRLSMALLALVILVTSLRVTDLLKGSFIIFGALILLSPTVHYWYLSWLLPFAVFFPSLPWLVMFGLSAFYFSAWVQFGKTGEWYQSIGYLRLQWIPFYVLWIPEFIVGAKKLFSSRTQFKADTLSVVIPTLNERSNLTACLESLRLSKVTLKEIVVVDGGSTDGTESVAETFPVKYLTARKGRGYQIATGVEACTSGVVLVLHADALVQPETPQKILEFLSINPEVIGGAIGQRFVASKPKAVLVLIEALNDFRAQWQGNSFGDQGQFFRRVPLMELGGFPEIPLMEDVELSARLKNRGELVLLDNELRCSARRWEKDHALSRIFQVLSLVVRYKLLRLIGKDPSQKLFREYYS